jgi:hypothetical protein
MTRIFLVSCVVALAPVQRLDAECAIPPPPCEALTVSHLVFYGEVQAVRPPPEGRAGSHSPLPSARFKVLRAFKGVKEGSLHEFRYYAAFGFRFEAKKSYLVYANHGLGDFIVVACTRTEQLAKADDAVRLAEVAELTRCRKTP